MSIQWSHFPKSQAPPDMLIKLVSVFQEVETSISSDSNQLKSNEVLLELTEGLQRLGF